MKTPSDVRRWPILGILRRGLIVVAIEGSIVAALVLVAWFVAVVVLAVS